jgi:hypothetical protein
MSWDKKSFGSRFDDALRRIGKRQSDLLGLLDLKSDSIFSTWKSPQRQTAPTVPQVSAMAEGLNVSPGWLAFGTDAATDSEQEILNAVREFDPRCDGAVLGVIRALPMPRSAVIPAGTLIATKVLGDIGIKIKAMDPAQPRSTQPPASTVTRASEEAAPYGDLSRRDSAELGIPCDSPSPCGLPVGLVEAIHGLSLVQFLRLVEERLSVESALSSDKKVSGLLPFVEAARATLEPKPQTDSPPATPESPPTDGPVPVKVAPKSSPPPNRI